MPNYLHQQKLGFNRLKKTVDASLKETPCFFKLDSDLAGSQSNLIMGNYTIITLFFQ